MMVSALRIVPDDPYIPGNITGNVWLQFCWFIVVSSPLFHHNLYGPVSVDFCIKPVQFGFMASLPPFMMNFIYNTIRSVLYVICAFLTVFYNPDESCEKENLVLGVWCLASVRSIITLEKLKMTGYVLLVFNFNMQEPQYSTLRFHNFEAVSKSNATITNGFSVILYHSAYIGRISKLVYPIKQWTISPNCSKNAL